MVELSALPTDCMIKVLSETDNAFEFTLTDVAGATVDITNDTVEFTARDRREGTIKIATKTNAPGAHSTPASGKTRFTLSKTDLSLGTVPGDEQRWYYEVRRIVAVTLQEIVYIDGQLRVKPNVGI